MLTIERTSVMNFENAMRGARNPLNSWARSDSGYDQDGNFVFGPNDLGLAKRLCAAGSDHRNTHPPGNLSGQVQIVALFHAVAVHAGQQNLSRAQLLGTLDPPNGINARGLTPSHGSDFETRLGMALPLLTTRVNGQYEHLIAETFRYTADQCRIVDGSSIDAYLVGSATQQ